MNKDLELVRAAVIKAVPEIVGMKRKKYAVTEGEFNSDDPAYAYKQVKTYRLITLADVLRAITTRGNHLYEVSNPAKNVSTGAMIKVSGIYNPAVWNLALSLDDQEPEVWAFLARMLVT
jgi:hypothetical protein